MLQVVNISQFDAWLAPPKYEPQNLAICAFIWHISSKLPQHCVSSLGRDTTKQTCYAKKD
jgi:hypothetical protein